MTRLFINYHNNPLRLDEYLECLHRNIDNPFIDEIICLCNDVPPVENDKLKIVLNYDRPTFQDFFISIDVWSEEIDIAIIANLDIYFNETLQLVHSIQSNEVYCITRWDKTDDGIKLFETPDSQDVWIFRGKVRPVNHAVHLRMSYWGVDNRLAHELYEAGYEVKNPARTIQVIHVHKSSVRPERTEHNVIPPPYLTIWPNTL